MPIKKLLELSDNDVGTALKVIEQSMANNWSGIFELKDGANCFYNETQYSPHNDPESPLYDPLYVPPPINSFKPPDSPNIDDENDELKKVLGW